MTRIALITIVIAAACTRGPSERSAEQALAGAACMQDAYGSALGCTANDVGIASATNIRNLDGTPLTSCVEGTTISFLATFLVDTTTATGRYDVGLYFATDGDGNGDGALTGSCDVNTIAPLDPATGLGSPNYVQLDGAPDACGDIDGAHDPQIVTVRVDNVLCTAGAGGMLSLPNCTSWRQAGSNDLCSGPADAFPGAPSKCNCDVGFTVPIAVAPPEASVVKSYVQLLCSTVRYGVNVANNSVTQALQLTALVDSNYGDLMTVHDSVLATTCSSAAIPVGGSYACTFDATFCGGSETDTATATLGDGEGVITRTSNALTVTATASGE